VKVSHLHSNQQRLTAQTQPAPEPLSVAGDTLVPVRDHRIAERSKNYRYSTNLQVAIDADARLVIVTGDLQPGNRNDCTVYRDCGIAEVLAGRPVMADGATRATRCDHALSQNAPMTRGFVPQSSNSTSLDAEERVKQKQRSATTGRFTSGRPGALIGTLGGGFAAPSRAATALAESRLA
jgi:hypothetical protein